MRHGALVAGVSLLLLAAVAVRAEIKTVVDHNENDTATAQFKFKNVPAPSGRDTATGAKFTIVSGERDGNGADLNVLNDGRLPGEQDEPASNFFFNAGTEGGRLVCDLGAVTEVRQINTYSWHPSTRGPQVYSVYGADGTASGFDARPRGSADPVKAGWTLIAKIDTRPKDGEAGGQYGVSITDSNGAIGKYRYVLFDVSRTEDTDDFGNTFFSEIDVVNGGPTTGPAAAAEPPIIVKAEDGKYEITINIAEAPELKEWVTNELAPVVEKWYPILVKALPSEGYSAPTKFSITFRANYRGVAATGGTRISASATWMKQNMKGESKGAIVHEMVHVVQQYRGRGNPGWLVEGLTDYLRWFKYEDPSLRPRPNPARAKYTDSYRVTGAFINYIVENVDKDFVVKMNAAMRQGKYSPDLWKEYTGKTVDELWADYIKTLQKQ